jgi:endonuclease/exonuclease/phosphatase family metal-dependent hydrolase
MFAVATWNLENLFRPGQGAGPTDQQAYGAKLDALAATINRLSPDVLAVQEVGDPAAVGDLRGRLNGSWNTELSPDADGRGIRVGFLARHAMHDVERVRAFPAGTSPVQLDDPGTMTAQMGRGALRVRVTVDSTPVDIVTCHLKSKLLHYPGGRFNPHDEGERARYAGYALALRAAEAITMRAEVTQRLGGQGQQRALIMLGDLNDEPLAATNQLLLGPPGSEIGTHGFDIPDAGDAQRMWNLAPRIPEARRFSRKFNGRGELIDHILVSSALVQHVVSVDTGAPTTDLPSVTTDPTERRDASGSDHAPVIAHFDIG